MSTPTAINAEEKLEIICSLYKPKMMKIAQNITKDAHFAEDAVQEALLRIANNLHKVADVSSPQTKGYIMTITRNAALSILKMKNGISEMEEEWEVVEDISDSGNIEEEVIAKINYERLIFIIRNLPKTYSDVLYMDWVMEFSIREIAEQLNVPESTVKKRINRGKKLLVKRIHECG